MPADPQPVPPNPASSASSRRDADGPVPSLVRQAGRSGRVWSWWLCVLVAAVPATAQLLREWILPRHWGPDECLMLQAATRLAAGQGMTSSLYDELQDVGEPTYRHLHHWAPGWTLTAAGLLRAGVDQDAIPILTNTAAAMVGMLGWVRLGAVVLGGWWALAFAALAGSAWFGSMQGPTDLPFWAMVPWVLMALMRTVTEGGAGPAARAGLLTAGCLLLRYAAVWLAAAAGLVILFFGAGTWRRRLVAATAYGLPTAAAFLGMMAVNRANAGSSSWVEEKGLGFFPGNLVSPEPVRFLAADTFGLELAVHKLRPSWRDHPWLVLPFGAAAVMLGAALCFGAAQQAGRVAPQRRTGHGGRSAANPDDVSGSGSGGGPGSGPDGTDPVRAFLICAAAGSVCLLGLLAGVTLLLAADEIKAINEPRYYREFMPAVGLAWMTVFASAARAVAACNACPDDGDDRPATPATTQSNAPAATTGATPSSVRAETIEDRLPTAEQAVTASYPWVVPLFAAGVGLLAGLSLWRVVKENVRDAVGWLRMEPRPGGGSMLETELRRLLDAAGPGPHRILDSRLGLPERFVRRDEWHAFRLAKAEQLAATRCTRRTFVIVVARTPSNDTINPDWDGPLARLHARRLGLKPAGVTWDLGHRLELYAGWVEPFAAGKLPGGEGER